MQQLVRTRFWKLKNAANHHRSQIGKFSDWVDQIGRVGRVHGQFGQPYLCVTIFAQVRFLFELNNPSPNNTSNNIESHYNSHFEDAILKSVTLSF